MNASKALSKPGESPNPNSGRRSFLWKTGAAMSAVFASAAAGISKSTPDQDAGSRGEVDKLSKQIGRLEDANVIRRQHQAYEAHLDQGMYEEVVGMFADEAEVVFNGGVFVGKDKGIRRLYCNHFAPRLTGKKIEAAPGFKPDPARQPDIVEVAADRKTATCHFPYSMQVGEPMTGNSSLVDMARLQGGGIVKWWEGGICEASYVKVGGSWKIRRLEYRATSKADYRPGQAYAKPIDIPAFSSVFPKNSTGPDKLVG
ncbi:MAG TPA: nuclear transport factor 2 family protein [Acidobacteriota bacterium]|nr:nuclear transport factor 2 family protein [Acidobacteriota bacterium]